MGSTASTLLSVIRHEGLRAARDRVLDRREGARRVHQMRVIADRPVGEDGGLEPAPVVNLSPIPPFPRRGGAQIQMLDRLQVEAEHRVAAHLYPIGETWRLEHQARGCREIRVIDATRNDPAVGLAATRRAVATATRLCETEILHIENLFGLPIELIPALQKDGYRVILSVHDFSLYCRRPHLVFEPAASFCNFETDLSKCAACLATDWTVEPAMLQSYRAAGEEALRAAETVVFPSTTHRDRYIALFPGSLDTAHTAVINPATGSPAPEGARDRRRPHLAVVGGLKRHKGGATVGQVLESVRRMVPGLGCTVFGDCEPELVTPLRRQSGIHIRGYYRSGKLPELLDESRITLALFPSIAAESYGLVVDECLHAGVPVVAFDTGEVGDRLRRLQGGIVVDRELGPQGLADAIITAIESNLTVPEGIRAALPTPAGVARQYLDLYASLRP